jgi:hypothetical protein
MAVNAWVNSSMAAGGSDQCGARRDQPAEAAERRAALCEPDLEGSASAYFAAELDRYGRAREVHPSAPAALLLLFADRLARRLLGFLGGSLVRVQFRDDLIERTARIRATLLLLRRL